MSAAAPEWLEEVPVLEKRPAATRTCKARHAASGPGDRGQPGERDHEERRFLEKQIVQQVSEQKHSGNAAEEQQPKNRGPAIQITPCRLERGIGAHVSINRSTGAGAEYPSVLYCGAQGIQGESVRPARAPIGSLDAVLCAFPIPVLHVRGETDRSGQAASRRNPLVPSVHQDIQRFAGNRSRNANCPWLIETGNDCGPSLGHDRAIIPFPTEFSVRHRTERGQSFSNPGTPGQKSRFRRGITSAGCARRCGARSSRGPRR